MDREKGQIVKVTKKNGIAVGKETLVKIITFMCMGKKCYVQELGTEEQYIVDTCDIENVTN